MTRRLESGSAAIEAVIVAVPLAALILLAIAGGRIEVAGTAVDAAAHNAARAASIARTGPEAWTDARTAAIDTLDRNDLHCARLTVIVDTAGFAVPVGEPATVTATVTCTLDLGDLAGLPGTHTISSRFVSVLDDFRTRT